MKLLLLFTLLISSLRASQAIARWDCVPFQTFSTTFGVGVVAFHESGINRVDFSVNGGGTVSVSTTSTNPTTGVVEYVLTLNASDYSDGLVTITAEAFPNTGTSRVLSGALDGAGAIRGEHSMWISANSGGSLPSLVRYVSTTGSDSNDGLTPGTAFATTHKAADSIFVAQGDCDGGVIYLLPGSYQIISIPFGQSATTVNRWLTVTAAPTFDKDDVTITGSTGSGFNSKLIRLDNVTLTGGVNSGGPLVDYIWASNSDFDGPGRLVGSIGFGDWSGQYVTDVSITNVSTGVGSSVVRNVTVDTIAGDCFSNSGIVLNSVERNQDKTGGGDIHADVYQNTSPSLLKNVILYGVTATDNILNSAGVWQAEGDVTDYAVINCNVIGQGNIGHAWDNVYVKNSSLSAAFVEDFSATGVVFENVNFYGGNPGPFTGVTYRDEPPPTGNGDAIVAGTTTVTTTLTLP